MRPDRFRALLCLSVPYIPRGDVGAFEKMRSSGHHNGFYMFEQMRPEADQIWADGAVTIPGDEQPSVDAGRIVPLSRKEE